jgi:glycerol-3-phosphate dehydrogenase (NAD(P)+)
VNVAVVGAGSWGTALAAHLVGMGHGVRVWARREEVARELRAGASPVHLPGVPLPRLEAGTDLAAAVSGAEIVVVAVPSEFARAAYRALAPNVGPGTVLVSATKGLELDTLLRMTEVAAEEAPGAAVAVVSGPSFAREVVTGQPTTVVVASPSFDVAQQVQHAVSTRTFRAYSSEDVIGVEMGGALKNVIAIAAGIVDGLGFGHNTAAALITRGLAEMTRLAVAVGGRADTLAGLAGLGDLVLTCTGALSRNRRLGQALGRGAAVADATRSAVEVAEGVRTTVAACALAASAGVEMPIAERMRGVLAGAEHPRAAVEALMLRTLKRE